MYGAKAECIAKAAFATWGPDKGKFEGDAKDKLVAAVFVVCDDPAATVESIDVPKAFAHAEFVKLSRALAVNPLAA